MLVTQFVAAGTLGLPGVAGILATIDKWFPGLEWGKHLREGVHGLISQFITEDEENGKLWADFAMTGAPAMLGWDWQSRLSMGGLPGVSEVNGIQPGLLMGSAPYSAAKKLCKRCWRCSRG